MPANASAWSAPSAAGPPTSTWRSVPSTAEVAVSFTSSIQSGRSSQPSSSRVSGTMTWAARPSSLGMGPTTSPIGASEIAPMSWATLVAAAMSCGVSLESEDSSTIAGAVSSS